MSRATRNDEVACSFARILRHTIWRSAPWVTLNLETNEREHSPTSALANPIGRADWPALSSASTEGSVSPSVPSSANISVNPPAAASACYDGCGFGRLAYHRIGAACSNHLQISG